MNRKEKIQDIRTKFSGSKFGQFWTKWNLQYLVLAIFIYLLKAALYFLIAKLNLNAGFYGFISPSAPLSMKTAIDDHIPFISYFYIFYVLYYVVPELFMWILSFYDKKKLFTVIIAVSITNVLACIAFVIQQVKMFDRDIDVINNFKDFSSVYNLDTFLKWAVNKQYIADDGALNCFPSLHAAMGMALSTIGLYTGKGEKHFPIGFRIFCALFGLGIIMSTVFVKQHYFVDSIAGAGLFLLVYYLFKLIFVPKYIASHENKSGEDLEVAKVEENQ